MAVMMTGGVGLRVSGLALERFLTQFKIKLNIKENKLCKRL